MSITAGALFSPIKRGNAVDHRRLKLLKTYRGITQSLLVSRQTKKPGVAYTAPRLQSLLVSRQTEKPGVAYTAPRLQSLLVSRQTEKPGVAYTTPGYVMSIRHASNI